MIVGTTTYPAKNSYNEALPDVADTTINIEDIEAVMRGEA